MVDYESFEQLYRLVGELNSKARVVRDEELKRNVQNIANEVARTYRTMMSQGLTDEAANAAKSKLTVALQNVMDEAGSSPDGMMLFQSAKAARDAAGAWQAGGIAATGPYVGPQSRRDQMLAQQLESGQRDILRGLQGQPPVNPEVGYARQKNPQPQEASFFEEEEAQQSLPDDYWMQGQTSSAADEKAILNRIGMIMALISRVEG